MSCFPFRQCLGSRNRGLRLVEPCATRVCEIHGLWGANRFPVLASANDAWGIQNAEVMDGGILLLAERIVLSIWPLLMFDDKRMT